MRIAIVAGLLLVLSLLAAPAHAVLVAYDFTVTANSGPLNGTSASGSLAFDSALIPAGGGSLSAIGLLSDLDFTWNGITYDETTANTGGLEWDPAGQLIFLAIGSNHIPGSVLIVAGTSDWGVAGAPSALTFAYATPEIDSDVFYGTGTFEPAQGTPAIPEPLTAGLAVFALTSAALAATRRSRA